LAASEPPNTSGYTWRNRFVLRKRGERRCRRQISAGLPDGFHQAAAEIFRRSPRADPGTPAGEPVGQVLAALTGETLRD
jgi:hypothetical protein